MSRNANNQDWYLPLFAGTETPARSGSLAKFPVAGLIPPMPGPPPWKLAGLVLWLDAAEASTLQLSGSAVTGWLDKSDAQNNGTQALAPRRPTRVATTPFTPYSVLFD